MARTNMNELLRKRMAATQQASEQQTGDAAYEQIFQMPVPQTETQFRDVPVCKLHPFFTADIGFHPYPHAKLEAFAEELKENGLHSGFCWPQFNLKLLSNRAALHFYTLADAQTAAFSLIRNK